MGAVPKVGGIALLCLVCGVAGGALTRNFGTSNYTLSYADFISIMLTAISLLMTLIAIVLAVFGVIGWRSIQNQTHVKTTQFLDDGFKPGSPLYQMLTDRVDEAMYRGIETMRMDLNDDEIEGKDR